MNLPTLPRRSVPGPRRALPATALVLVLGLLAAHLGALAHLATHEHVLPAGSSRLAHAAEAPLPPGPAPARPTHAADECAFVAVMVQASLAPTPALVRPAALPACDARVVHAPAAAPGPAVLLLLLAPSHSPPRAA